MVSSMWQGWGPLAAIRSESEGKWTAEVVGLPEICVTSESREQALAQVQQLLQERLASGQLVSLSVVNPLVGQAGWAKGDPTYQEFLDEMRRYREELEREPQNQENP